MILELIGGAAIAAFVSLIVCRFVIAGGPVDMPDAGRKDHEVPTRTGGGVGIAFGFGVGLFMLALVFNEIRSELSPRAVVLVTIGVSFAYVFAAIGLLDDAYPLPPRLKLALFTMTSFGAAAMLGVVRIVPLDNNDLLILPIWFAAVGTALWIFTVVNAVNFMDGVNGLATGSVGIAMAVLAGIAFVQGSWAGVAVALFAAAAIGGFLYWNFPSGRLFAGDAGSLFVGALAALGSIIVIHRAGISPMIPPILFFPLLADALVTLAWRAWRRRSLLDGHSEHLYQIARRAGMSHTEVTLLYWTATAVCGVIAFALLDQPLIVSACALAVLAAVAVVISIEVRRFADRRGLGGV